MAQHKVNSFYIGNGTKQGGILSPYLFTRYIRQLLFVISTSKIGCHITVQHVSADTVVRAMNVKYRKWRLGESCNSETHQPISIELGISNHITHPTPQAKFGYNRFEGGLAAHA